MAVTKIWPVRGKADSPLSYVTDEMKTANPKWNREELSALTDVMHYAADEDKTEKQFFVTGINCSVQIARDQFVTVKKQFGKEGGIIAYHGYQSFEKGEVSPELAHRIGVEFAQRVWGEDYQVLVATHLNTDHIHNHFVVNSVSFRHGRRLREKQWYELNSVSDEICREHGLSVVEHPKGKGLPYQEHRSEQQGGSTRKNVTRAAVDEAIAVSTNLKEFEIVMKSMGYTCSFRDDRKHWTVKMKEWKKPMRLSGLGEDYAKERILERIAAEPEHKIFEVFQKTIHVRRQYRLPTRRERIRRIGGLKGLYLHYCYLLGYLPRYRKDPVRVPHLIRDDIRKLDMITEEARFIGRESINDMDHLKACRDLRMKKAELLTGERTQLRNLIRRKIPEKEKEDAKERIDEIGKELKVLRKEIRLTEDIEKRSSGMQENIRQIEREEMKRDERRR